MGDKIDELIAEYPHIWKTRSSFLSWIRGGIRRSLWNRSPQKLEFIKKNRIRIPNPNPRGKVDTVWGAQCALTGEVIPLNQCEVDHCFGNHSLSTLSDIQSFVEGICLVTEKDLQFVSKTAHKVKSYAEKHNISFEEALAIKKAIDIVKNKQDKQWLEERGIIPASTQVKRRKQIEDALKPKGENNAAH